MAKRRGGGRRWRLADDAMVVWSIGALGFHERYVALRHHVPFGET
jgi:hypothetical protein